ERSRGGGEEAWAAGAASEALGEEPLPSERDRGGVSNITSSPAADGLDPKSTPLPAPFPSPAMARMEGFRIQLPPSSRAEDLPPPEVVVTPAKTGLKISGEDPEAEAGARRGRSKPLSTAESPGAKRWVRLMPAAICQFKASAWRNCSARVPS